MHQADMAHVQVSCCEEIEAGNVRHRAGQLFGNAGWDSCNLFSALPGQISVPQRQNVTAVSWLVQCVEPMTYSKAPWVKLRTRILSSSNPRPEHKIELSCYSPVCQLQSLQGSMHW